jgi:hypothetical protein
MYATDIYRMANTYGVIMKGMGQNSIVVATAYHYIIQETNHYFWKQFNYIGND